MFREFVMRKFVLALLAILAFATAASAQNFPTRPITIIVPFSAGGPSDVMARILAERMKVTLGEAILVENVTGAAGSIGVGRAVRSAPDGYTISFGHLGTHVANGAIYKLGFDLVTDLEPVALLPSNPMIIVSKKEVPATSLRELLAWLKARPTPPTAGTAGAGSGSHIAGLYFERRPPQAAICAVSRHRTRDERSRRRPDRSDRRPDFELDRAGARRQHPRLCHHR